MQVGIRSRSQSTIRAHCCAGALPAVPNPRSLCVLAKRGRARKPSGGNFAYRLRSECISYASLLIKVPVLPELDASHVASQQLRIVNSMKFIEFIPLEALVLSLRPCPSLLAASSALALPGGHLARVARLRAISGVRQGPKTLGARAGSTPRSAPTRSRTERFRTNAGVAAETPPKRRARARHAD